MKNILSSALIVLVFLVISLVSYNAYAAITATDTPVPSGANMQTAVIDATVTADGTYTTTHSYYGYLTEVWTSAGAGTSASYDITITDPNRPGADIMGGALGDRSVTTGQIANPLQNGTPVWRAIHGPLEINYSNTGSSGVVKLRLEIQQVK